MGESEELTKQLEGGTGCQVNLIQPPDTASKPFAV